MKLRFFKVIISLILIGATACFLWNLFWIFWVGFGRECYGIALTDNNREQIASLMDADYYEKISDISRANRVECHFTYDEDRVTFYYEDDTLDAVCEDNLREDLLCLFIQNEGYIVYFRSSEFAGDLKNTIIPLLIGVFAVFLLRKYKHLENENL